MTLHIGMVGTGDFSRKHAQILSRMEGVAVRAFCGTSQEKADRLARDFSHARAYDSLLEMLDRERLDAVYISVTPDAHGAIERELIERNIPFFVEKPQQIEREIKKKSLITSVGYHFRYSNPTQRLKQYVQQVRLGMAVGRFMGGLPGKAWWRNEERSGGQWNEQTTHIVDLLRYIAGEAVEVHAFFATKVMDQLLDDVTIPDVGVVNIKLQNGTVATISNTCILPPGIGQIGLELFTDRSIFDWNPHELRIDSDDGDFGQVETTDDPYVLENEAFIHAIRTGDTSHILSDYQDALKTQQLVV